MESKETPALFSNVIHYSIINIPHTYYLRMYTNVRGFDIDILLSKQT